MIDAILPGAVLMVGSTLATPAKPPEVPRRPAIVRRHPSPAVRPADLALYSAHARRLVQSYLRLRLLELREARLERVRSVIERRLGVDALFAETP